MAVTYINSNGLVPNSAGTVHSVTNTELCYSLIFHNVDTVSRELKVWINGGTARQILATTLEAGVTLIFPAKFSMSNGNSIEARCEGSSTAITYWISTARVT